MESIKTSFVSGAVTIQIEGPAEEVRRCLVDSAIAEHVTKALSSAGKENETTDPQTVELALEHAWNWFSLHADHRMRSVNFFLISVAFLSTAYVTALRFAHPIAAAGICVAGFLLAICFNRLELRIRELVKAGEQALRPLERVLSKAASVSQLNIIDSVETSKHRFVKYSIVINTLHWVVATAFLAGFVLAIWTYIAGLGGAPLPV